MGLADPNGHYYWCFQESTSSKKHEPRRRPPRSVLMNVWRCIRLIVAVSVACASREKPGRVHAAQVCFGATRCSPLHRVAALSHSAWSGDWRASLPTVALKGDVRRNCVLCDMAALSRSAEYPHETWQVARGTNRLSDLHADALAFIPNSSHKKGWVPPLLQHQVLDTSVGWRKYEPKAKLPVDLPCSSARGEDAAVLRTFFSDRWTGSPLRGGTFLEIGGANGLEQSNTWIFEVCLGCVGDPLLPHPTLKLPSNASSPPLPTC